MILKRLWRKPKRQPPSDINKSLTSAFAEKAKQVVLKDPGVRFFKYADGVSATHSPSNTVVIADLTKLLTETAHTRLNITAKTQTRQTTNRFQRLAFNIVTNKGLCEMPTLNVSDNGKISIQDGRHRIAMFHYFGFKNIPVKTSPENVDVLRKTIGSNRPENFQLKEGLTESYTWSTDGYQPDYFEAHCIYAKSNPSVK